MVMGLKRQAKTYSYGQILGNSLDVHVILLPQCIPKLPKL